MLDELGRLVLCGTERGRIVQEAHDRAGAADRREAREGALSGLTFAVDQNDARIGPIVP